MFIASIAHIYIGNKVRFGPSVTIRGGNHVIDVVGKFMYDITDAEKRPSDDGDVIIEDDVWIGTNVTILKGVSIGRGSVVAAGALVNKSTPPYSVVGGVPAKVLKYRFSPDQILEHEKNCMVILAFNKEIGSFCSSKRIYGIKIHEISQDYLKRSIPR